MQYRCMIYVIIIIIIIVRYLVIFVALHNLFIVLTNIVYTIFVNFPAHLVKFVYLYFPMIL